MDSNATHMGLESVLHKRYLNQQAVRERGLCYYHPRPVNTSAEVVARFDPLFTLGVTINGAPATCE